MSKKRCSATRVSACSRQEDVVGLPIAKGGAAVRASEPGEMPCGGCSPLSAVDTFLLPEHKSSLRERRGRYCDRTIRNRLALGPFPLRHDLGGRARVDGERLPRRPLTAEATTEGFPLSRSGHHLGRGVLHSQAVFRGTFGATGRRPGRLDAAGASPPHELTAVERPARLRRAEVHEDVVRLDARLRRHGAGRDLQHPLDALV